MILFSKPARKATQSRGSKAPKTLLDAHGVREGGSMVWAHGNAPTGITQQERESIRRMMRTKEINEPLALAIKGLMLTRTRAQIVAHFRGRKGKSKSTIEKYYAALSK